MKRSRTILLVGAAVLSIAVGGCHRKRAEGAHEHAGAKAAAAEHHDETITYKEGKGLHVPERTAQLIGLKVEDAKERALLTVVRFDAQVYRSAAEARFASLEPMGNPTALASGEVNTNEAAFLPAGKVVNVKARNGETFQAQIAKVNEAFGKSANRAEVLLRITDDKGGLELGAFVEASVRKEAKSAAVVAPKSALLRTAEGMFVYTASGERFFRTAVTTGASDGEFVEITDGLYPGDQIVVQPVMTLWMAELQTIRGGASCTDGH